MKRLPGSRAFSLALAVAAVLGAPRASSAAGFDWLPAAGGTFDWNTATNWSPSTAIPNAAGDIANLNINILGNQIINLNEPITVGSLLLGDAAGASTFTIAPNTGGSLIFNSGASGTAATLANSGGANVISSSIALTSNVSLTATSALTLSGALSGASLIKSGAGNLALTGSAVNTQTLVINGGNVDANKSDNVRIASAVTINNGGTLTFQQSRQLNTGSFESTVPMVINAGGTLNMNGKRSELGPTVVNGGQITNSGGNQYNGGLSAEPDDSYGKTNLTLIGGSLLASSGFFRIDSDTVVAALPSATISKLDRPIGNQNGQQGSNTAFFHAAEGTTGSGVDLQIGTFGGDGHDISKNGLGTLQISNSATAGAGDAALSASGSLFVNSGTLLATARTGQAFGGSTPFNPTNGAFGAGAMTLNGGTTELTGIAASVTNLQTSLAVGGGAFLAVNNAGGAGNVTALGFRNSFPTTRSNSGSLVVVPTTGGLGSTEVLFSFNATKPVSAGTGGGGTGIVAPWMVRQASGSDTTGDFLTYSTAPVTIGSTRDNANAAVTSADAGFVTATYSSSDLNAATNADVVSTGALQITGDRAAYALRTNGAITEDMAGRTLTLGTGSGQAGLILNGGSVGVTTLAFGTAQGVIYAGTGSASTISSAITNSGSPGLVKFGAGELILSGTNSGFAGGLFINQGTITASANSNLGNASHGITFNGGALKTNGLTALDNGTTNRAVTLNAGGGTFNVAAPDTLTVRGLVSGGTGFLVKEGDGTLVLNGANTFGGQLAGRGTLTNQTASGIVLNAGTIRLGASSTTFSANVAGTSAGNETQINTGALGRGALLINGGTLADDGATRTVLNNVVLAGDATFASTGAGSIIFSSGALTVPTTTMLTKDVALTINNTVDFQQAIRGFTYGVTKKGGGTMIVSGAADYAGTTTVVAGTLLVSGSIAASTALNVNNGGSLLLGGTSANRLGDTAAVSLATGAGGKLGFDQTGATAQLGETVGALTLTSSSIIDLGAGGFGSVLRFADSSANSGLWSGTLNIYHWSGSASGGGLDQLFFGSTSNGLTASQLSQITFFSDAGITSLGSPQLLSTGELVAVPEPSTVTIGVVMLGLVAFRERRRFRSRRAA